MTSTHAGTIGVRAGHRRRRSTARLTSYRAAARERRARRANRAHALRASGARVPSVPGSEHTHILRRGGF